MSQNSAQLEQLSSTQIGNKIAASNEMPHWDITTLCGGTRSPKELKPIQCNIRKIWCPFAIFLFFLDTSRSECYFFISLLYFSSIKICKYDGPQLHIQLLVPYKRGHENIGPNVKKLCASCQGWGEQIVKAVSSSDPCEACQCSSSL